MTERDPESIAAREAIDAVLAARYAGKASQDAVNWVYTKGFEQFRKEAYAMASAERERQNAREAEARKREHRTFWQRVWGDS